MDECNSYCLFLLFSEITAKGTGLEIIKGKEDPVELDFILILLNDLIDIE